MYTEKYFPKFFQEFQSAAADDEFNRFANEKFTTTLRLEVCSFKLELRKVDVAGDAPGLEGELLPAVNELGAGAGGFHLIMLS